MKTLYEYSSTRYIQYLYEKTASKPYTLLDCEEFSNWGKLGLLATVLTYFLLPIMFLIAYYLYIDSLTAWEFFFYALVLAGYVWLLRKIIDCFLNMYKKNLEAEFKNLPSSRNLLLVIKGILIFLKKRGFTQCEISSFIDEELRDQVNFCKTTVNVWFGMANKINRKKINKLNFSKVKIKHLERLFEYFHIGFPAVTSRYKLVQLTAGNHYGTNHSTY